MSDLNSPGARFRAALVAEKPLQVIGAINANHALLAKRAATGEPTATGEPAWS